MKRKQDDHCVRYFISGDCYECDYGYYWDINSKSCLNLYNYENAGCSDNIYRWPFKANGGRDVMCASSRPSNCDFIDRDALRDN